MFLSDEEKQLKHTIQNDFAQFNVKLNEFESKKRDHLNYIKGKIELHKEALKKQIEIISNEMIQKLVQLNEDFLDKSQLLKQYQNIENEFRNQSVNVDSIRKLKLAQDSIHTMN